MAESKAKTKKGLGKGLGAFFENVEVEAVKEEKAKDNSGVMTIKIRDIEPNPDQPRRTFDKEKLEALSESIKEHGLIQPILVKKQENGMYIIIAGERRWRASKLAGLKEIPCIEGDYTEKEVMELALIENLQREDLNPIEESEGYLKLMESFQLTQEEVAQRVGKSRSAVANSLRLNKLCDEIKEMVIKDIISQGHARALLSLDDKDKQIFVAEKIIKEGLNVRQTERLVNDILNERPKKKAEAVDRNIAANYIDIENRLAGFFGAKVKLKAGKNKGKIEIEYSSEKELSDILDRIK